MPRTAVPGGRPRSAEIEELWAAAREAGLEARCAGDPGIYADYVSPTDIAADAPAWCEGCEVIQICRKDARVNKPSWGVWGGEIWKAGKRWRPGTEDEDWQQESSYS